MTTELEALREEYERKKREFDRAWAQWASLDDLKAAAALLEHMKARIEELERVEVTT